MVGFTTTLAFLYALIQFPVARALVQSGAGACLDVGVCLVRAFWITPILENPIDPSARLVARCIGISVVAPSVARTTAYPAIKGAGILILIQVIVKTLICCTIPVRVCGTKVGPFKAVFITWGKDRCCSGEQNKTKEANQEKGSTGVTFHSKSPFER
jgi:hypothetical protein